MPKENLYVCERELFLARIRAHVSGNSDRITYVKLLNRHILHSKFRIFFLLLLWYRSRFHIVFNIIFFHLYFSFASCFIFIRLCRYCFHQNIYTSFAKHLNKFEGFFTCFIYSMLFNVFTFGTKEFSIRWYKNSLKVKIKCEIFELVS